jgi:SAM-dependent methyltransferase
MFVDALLSRQPIRRDGNNLIYETPGLSDDWAQRQDVAPDRYEAHSNEDSTVARLFGDFVAAGLHSAGIDRNAAILDIGCGITHSRPDYAVGHGWTNFIGLEPLTKLTDRDFPCLVGAVAEHIPLEDQSVDAVLFPTSLDHIEDADAAIMEVGRILKPRGQIFIWQGLNGPEDLARQKSAEHALSGSPLRQAFRVAAGTADYALLRYRMLRRARHLKNGVPLDTVHFRWFTRGSLIDMIAGWGLTVVRELVVPGTTSMFVEATQRR